MTRKRLGFFTRLLDNAPPKERYRLATEQIRHAQRIFQRQGDNRRAEANGLGMRRSMGEVKQRRG